jgi:hypothetical protein
MRQATMNVEGGQLIERDRGRRHLVEGLKKKMTKPMMGTVHRTTRVGLVSQCARLNSSVARTR